MTRAFAATRWGTLLVCIICMVMIANLDPIKLAHGWSPLPS
jgi:hypothetical protein